MVVEAARVNPWSDENFDEDVENKRRVRSRMKRGMRRRWRSRRRWWSCRGQSME